MSSASQRRRIGDGWHAGARRVVIALEDFEEAGLVAKLFAAADVLPTLVFTCTQLVREAREAAYGLIVLDGRLVCEHDSRCLREVKELSSAPLITVGSVDGAQQDGVDLELGPQHDLEEIVARGTALIDMTRPVRLPESLRWGPLELDLARHQGRWDGRLIRLSALQFRIMEVLALAAGSVVTDEQLSRRVWNHCSFEDRERLEAHIRRIRKAIEPNASSPRFLVRVRAKGYRLVDPSEDDWRSSPITAGS
jgi:two-component system, OmpR family, response regulator RegX3